MWASALSDIIVASLLIFSTVNIAGSNNWGNSVFLALTFSFQHFAIEGVALLLMQYGCGYQAARRAGILASLWVLVAFAVYLCFLRYTYIFALEIVWDLALFFFYFSLWIMPEQWLFRRKAVIPYAKFWCAFRAGCLALVIGYAVSGASCYRYLSAFPLILLVTVKPYMIYLTLLWDSVWWQGASGNTDSGAKKEQLLSPLMGIEVSYVDAQELAQEVDNLNSQGTVKLLNFAYLSLDSSSLLGSGSYSKVYRGTYKSTPVAIKLLFTVDLNPEVIKRCSSEAQILSKLSHPNVVDIFGVSVLPPRYGSVHPSVTLLLSFSS